MLLHVAVAFWFVPGLLASWAEGQPLAGTDDWWLLTSLILLIGLGVLVPTVFLPHGKVFARAGPGTRLIGLL